MADAPEICTTDSTHYEFRRRRITLSVNAFGECRSVQSAQCDGDQCSSPTKRMVLTVIALNDMHSMICSVQSAQCVLTMAKPTKRKGTSGD